MMSSTKPLPIPSNSVYVVYISRYERCKDVMPTNAPRHHNYIFWQKHAFDSSLKEIYIIIL